MTVNEKNKDNDKIWQNKGQYNLDRKTANFQLCHQKRLANMEDLKYFTEKRNATKCCTLKRFEYSPLGSELKKQTNIVEKQCQGLNKIYEFNENKGDDETLKKR